MGPGLMRALFLTLAMLGACAAAPPSPAAPQPSASAPLALAGTHWMRIDDDNAAPHFPTLDFGDARASGFAGCNRWFADVSVDGAALSFGPVGSTRMMCPPPAMAAETALFDALSRTRAARREGEELIFLDEGGAMVARFAPGDAPSR
jgi:heat shock protein HslJ